MDLIIVESPTKAKTISKFLGRQYIVESSFGHVRDLPKSEMGVDTEHDFKPKYVVPTKSKKTITKLKQLAKQAGEVILASDEDREGEAIAWHLSEALGLDATKAKRIVFHEITKSAIEDALQHPRQIDPQLVDAQQARRILDRLVGYELSPFLWKKVAKGLSAGRVQSVAVRLIVEREREIQKFKTEEYWTITGQFTPDNQDQPFAAQLAKVKGKSLGKLAIANKDQADELMAAIKDKDYSVLKIDKKQTKKNPAAPFTTSTLQQTANHQLGFSAKQTMTLAQKLYELGHITYMRTDSLNLSDKFLLEAKEYLNNELGDKYTIASPRHFKTKSKGAQEAHEAIRPTVVANTPDSLKDKLESGQYRLYRLIWQRAVATQMPEAILDTTNVDVLAAQDYIFRANGQIIRFDGYLKIYPEKTKEQTLPALTEGEALKLLSLDSDQHFTNPPARYSDASLVKELEKHGVGRPSTYAPTIATIIDRNYVTRDDKKRLAPTEIAFVVIDLLVAHFKEIVDYQFTADMEANLDQVANGQKTWVPVISDFYSHFHQNLENKYKEIMKTDIVPEEKTSEVCDKCGSPMIIKTGRYGKFLACSNYPDCRNIKSLKDKAEVPQDNEKLKELTEKYKGEVCPKCGGPMAVKNGKFGPFLGCSAYPKCKTIKNINDDSQPEITCPKCKTGQIVKKFSRRGAFWACSNYPDCKNAYWGRPTGEKCPNCSALLIDDKGQIKCSDKDCGYTA